MYDFLNQHQCEDTFLISLLLDPGGSEERKKLVLPLMLGTRRWEMTENEVSDEWNENRILILH